MAHPKRAEIRADDGRVVVDRITDGTVRVTWTCGGTREFTPAGLRNAVANFDLVTLYAESASPWMEDRDTRGDRFVCRLKDGRFYANDSYGEARHVSWATFKRALLARAKDA